MRARRLDQRGDAEPGARARESRAGPCAPKPSGPIRRVQASGMVGSDSACASKSLSSSPAPRLEPPRDLAPVDMPGRVGELELAVDDRPGAAGDRPSAAARASLGKRASIASAEAGIIAGVHVHGLAKLAPAASPSSAKRALVPPMSQTRTGKAKRHGGIKRVRGAPRRQALAVEASSRRLSWLAAFATSRRAGWTHVHFLRILRRRRHGARRARAALALPVRQRFRRDEGRDLRRRTGATEHIRYADVATLTPADLPAAAPISPGPRFPARICRSPAAIAGSAASATTRRRAPARSGRSGG